MRAFFFLLSTTTADSKKSPSQHTHRETLDVLPTIRCGESPRRQCRVYASFVAGKAATLKHGSPERGMALNFGSSTVIPSRWVLTWSACLMPLCRHWLPFVPVQRPSRRRYEPEWSRIWRTGGNIVAHSHSHAIAGVDHRNRMGLTLVSACSPNFLLLLSSRLEYWSLR